MLECVSILVDRDQSTPPSCCSSAWSQILVSQLLTPFQPAWWQLCTGRASERVWSRPRVICRPRFPPSYSKTLPLPSCQRFRQQPCKNPALEANPSGPQYFHQKKKKKRKKQTKQQKQLLVCLSGLQSPLPGSCKRHALGRMASFQSLALCCMHMGQQQSPSVQCRPSIHYVFTIPSNPRSNKGSFYLVWDRARAGLGKVFLVGLEGGKVLMRVPRCWWASQVCREVTEQSS